MLDHHFHHWRKSAEGACTSTTKAGEKLFVDYAGDRLAIMDADSGKEQPVETFVATLGASELTYVEISAIQQSDDWIRSNKRALRYCGGSPQAIIPDNLRSTVSRSGIPTSRVHRHSHPLPHLRQGVHSFSVVPE